MKFFRGKQIKQQSGQNSATQLLHISREGTPVKRMPSMTATSELSEYGSKPEEQNEKRDSVPAINIHDVKSYSKPRSPVTESAWLPSKRYSLTESATETKDGVGSRADLGEESHSASDASSRCNSSPSIEWFPLRRKTVLPTLNWNPPRDISPVLLPYQYEKGKKEAATASHVDLGDSNSPNNLSPRKLPEGSEVHKRDRCPSPNSWFPAEEIQFNV